MRLYGKKDIFFDLDHTLWDFEKNSALAFRHVFEQQNIPVSLPDFLEHFVPANMHYWELFREDKITQEELRYNRIKEPFDALGYTATDEEIARISEAYIKQLPLSTHLFNGTLELLDYLKQKYTLHIITNGFDRVQAGKINNSGLSGYFATVTNCDNAGCKKPNPAIFEYALTLAGASKETSVMIGDCIIADVNGALNCGIDAIYFNKHRLQADDNIKQVNQLLELKNFL